MERGGEAPAAQFAGGEDRERLARLLGRYQRRERGACMRWEAREERCHECMFMRWLRQRQSPQAICAAAARMWPETAEAILTELLEVEDMIRGGAAPERPVEPREKVPFCCPVCGAEEPETIVSGVLGVLGCEVCLRIEDAGDWREENR